jgi:hypothetical protein
MRIALDPAHRVEHAKTFLSEMLARGPVAITSIRTSRSKRGLERRCWLGCYQACKTQTWLDCLPARGRVALGLVESVINKLDVDK